MGGNSFADRGKDLTELEVGGAAISSGLDGADDMMGTALAAKQTAFCPSDGQLAQWTGIQKGTYPNQVCEYKHFLFDTKTKRSVKHVFWHSCNS